MKLKIVHKRPMFKMAVQVFDEMTLPFAWKLELENKGSVVKYCNCELVKNAKLLQSYGVLKSAASAQGRQARKGKVKSRNCLELASWSRSWKLNGTVAVMVILEVEIHKKNPNRK
jgi:hypothetical protein